MIVGASEPGREIEGIESPEAVRLSLAAAMTLGLRQGRFYRDAKLGCINLLETYASGCAARCAYCGLARDRIAPRTGLSFIRVGWPTYRLDTVLDRMDRHRSRFSRVCVSMISRRRGAADAVEIVRRIRGRLDVPVSVLLTPTFVDRSALEQLRGAGSDRIGIAVDTATERLFVALRGEPSGGLHAWERYWTGLADAVSIFGERRAGCHLIVGLGESEREMIEAIDRTRSLGAVTHLFSFYPEAGSALESREPPPMGQYRRVQVARYLVDEGLGSASDMRFDEAGRLGSFGVAPEVLERVLASGEPFRTSGCPGPDGSVACNRPFANSRPGPDLRNYPFPLQPDDVRKARSELWT